MPVLHPICHTPLPSGLRLVRRRLEWRDREGKEKRETKKRVRDEAETIRGKEHFGFKLLPTRAHIGTQPQRKAPYSCEQSYTGPRKLRDMMQNEGKSNTEEDRRIVLELK